MSLAVAAALKGYGFAQQTSKWEKGSFKRTIKFLKIVKCHIIKSLKIVKGQSQIKVTRIKATFFRIISDSYYSLFYTMPREIVEFGRKNVVVVGCCKEKCGLWGHKVKLYQMDCKSCRLNPTTATISWWWWLSIQKDIKIYKHVKIIIVRTDVAVMK
jgi:hypothetical protein